VNGATKNKQGVCTALTTPTCPKANPSDNQSIVYALSNGQCDNSNNDILNAFVVYPNLVVQMQPFFSQDPTLQSSGIGLVGVRRSGVPPSAIIISFDFVSTSPVTNLQVFCTVATAVSTSLLGVVDPARIACDPTNITSSGGGNYQMSIFITDINAPPGPGPTAPGGGEAIPPIGIAAIVIFVIGIILIIIAIIIFFVLKKKDSERV